MLEKLAAQILNRYIGCYVENLNTQNLSIGLLQGAVELENLPLRKNALDDLDLPGIVFKSGHIGKVILRIKSYKSIREPWIVEIHGLRFVIGPGEKEKTVDKEEEIRKRDEKKKADLQAMETKWRSKHGQSTSMYSFLYERSSSIITTIMENLQFEIHDVHVRYEDSTTLPQTFACGILIKNLTSKSTDEKWIPNSGERSWNDMMYKLLMLDDFSIYWDSDSKVYGDLKQTELISALKAWEELHASVNLNENKKENGHFLLHPVCGKAKLTKNSSIFPLRARNTPRILLDVLLGEISLHLSHNQYKQAIALLSELSRSERRKTYQDGRPSLPVTDKNCRSWWRWAIEAHVKQIKKKRERTSREFCLNRARNNVEYVKCYERVIRSKTDVERISASELSKLEAKLEDIEKDMIVPEIQILREIVFGRTEQALVKKQKKPHNKPQNRSPTAKGWGSWLRGWSTGWGSQGSKKDNEEESTSAVDPPATDEAKPSQEPNEESVYKDMDEEDLYEMFGAELTVQDTNDTFMKRDSVFMKINFKLDAGTLTLHEESFPDSSFLGIEFRDVTSSAEWRPRYYSSLVKTDLGGLFVKDLSNSKSQFSELIKPQKSLDTPALTPQKETENVMQSSFKGFFGLLSSKGSPETLHNDGSSVFTMLYQNQPKSDSNRYANRLEIVSAPIVITYLPNLVERVKEFFKSTETEYENMYDSDETISAAAKEKYEAWKRKSQLEIRRSVRRMIDGKSTPQVPQDRWAVTLNISAPEIILPENINDANTDIVIANLGHMTFKNHNEDDLLPKIDYNNGMNVSYAENKMDEDDFVTPPDTPPNEANISLNTQSDTTDGQETVDNDLSDSPSRLRLNEKLMYEKMYEQFQMKFTDLQVLVAKSNEKWETSRNQGKGPHHLIEKFSVDLLLERRVVQTIDPKCPAVKLRGNLPRLTIHLNHDKVHSFFQCLDKVTQSEEKPQGSETSILSRQKSEDSLSWNKERLRKQFQNMQNQLYSEQAAAKQLLCQFSMNEVSVLLEDGTATPLSVLEVRGIQAEFTKRLYDHMSVFSIHSLLLVDTKQQLGADYELLLASNRNVKMDLGSGNMLDSGTTSPMSDGLPAVKETSETPGTKNILSSVAQTLTKANVFSLSTSPGDRTASLSSCSSQPEEDLITVEWTVNQMIEAKRSSRPTQERIRPPVGSMLNVKFNSLDLVLNLKTWIELLDFLHKLKPPNKEDDAKFAKKLSFDHETHSPQAVLSQNTGSVKSSENNLHNEADTEILVLFSELNVLLMRHIETPDKIIGRKVTTLSMHDTKVHAFLGENIQNKTNMEKEKFFMSVDANGSVGGLDLQDLTNAIRDDHGVLQGFQVLRLGHFPDQSRNNMSNAAANQSEDLADENGHEAFKFSMQKGKRHHHKNDEEMQFTMDEEMSEITEDCQEEVILNLQLASVLYMHTPRLVAEVLAIADEAGDIANAKMNPDTKQAVKDMAYSFMDKSMAALGNYQSTDFVSKSFSSEQAKSPQGLFKLTVEMESPIVALPKCHGSFELLVGNLGKITVKNGHSLNRVNDSEQAMDYLCIEIVDMNVCSRRQIEEEKLAKKSPRVSKPHKVKKTLSGPSLWKLKESMSPQKSYFDDNEILHDTSIRLTVMKEPFDQSATKRNELDKRFPTKKIDGILDDTVDDGPINDKKMSVDVKMTLPLSVTLSKAAYEQLLKTLDHISYGGNIDYDDIEELEGTTSNFDDSAMSSGSLGQRSSECNSFTSHQSTPARPDKPKIFEAPGLEIMPHLTQVQSENLSITTRKYTPISANIVIPQIEFKLTQDLSEGERGVVKITLEGFTAKFEKENRSTTALDLTLGSLGIEDLFQNEDSLHRHIVSSMSYGAHGHKGFTRMEHLSSSCPDIATESSNNPARMSTSLPAKNDPCRSDTTMLDRRIVDFRPQFASGAFGVSHSTHGHQRLNAHSNKISINFTAEEGTLTPPCSPSYIPDQVMEVETLVRIRAFLVDGKSTAYKDIYDRTNRRIDIDFNSLDCKINPDTWVILLDFFGIGTAPKKVYQVDPNTEKSYTQERRLAVSSYYENQPDDFINSEIDFKVRSFSLIFNKEEYEFVKANISNFETHVQIRDGVLGLCGQLGSLSVCDLSPNGTKYPERFVFSGAKALDFKIKKYDEYDEKLTRQFDIMVKLRMSAINYVHTHRFHQELVAYLLHFQQLQEVLGRMRAASVGQTVNSQSRRQARILLDIEADSPVLLIPESSHSDRLVVADLGRLKVENSFIWSGDFGTLSSKDHNQLPKQNKPDFMPQPLQSNRRDQCLLDVLHADLDQMDLYTARRSTRGPTEAAPHCTNTILFSSYFVYKNPKPLLKEKCKLSLQIERNLEKETTVRIVPDTSISGELSSVYCTLDLQQYWLVRGILDHNLGEPIPEFPQPTAFMQPPSIHTILSGSVYTGMSVDMHLLNVSVELLRAHGQFGEDDDSLARLDYVKSQLSYRSYSDQTKTVNLSCETFVASDMRWEKQRRTQRDQKNVFTTVLGPMRLLKSGLQSSPRNDCGLQFELQLREGPDFLHFTALLVDMRVYIISDWLSDIQKYIIVNPDQPRCDMLREKAATLLTKYRQIVPGQEKQKDPDTIRDEQFKLNVTNTDFVLIENASQRDSDAVILCTTSVLHYNPTLPKLRRPGQGDHRKLLNCTLQSMEVFSCQLDKESNTELSIVDPMRVNIEIDSINQQDLSVEERNFHLNLLDQNKLEISISELNTRVSYNDLLLFLAITKSFSQQKRDSQATKEENESLPGSKTILPYSDETIERLTELGYSRKDASKALIEENGNIDKAAEWLVENANVLPLSEISGSHKETTNKKGTEMPFNIGKMFLHVNSMSVCLIDDCADSDVPLAEFAMKSLIMQQNLSNPDPGNFKVASCYAGKATFSLSGDYYNRMLSLWEPYLEPWRCSLNWHYNLGVTSSVSKWDFNVEASDRLDITVTSTMMETIKKTKESWTRAYEKLSKPSDDLIDFGTGSSNNDSPTKRNEFIPYILRNMTGLPLRFVTHVSAIQQRSVSATAVSGSTQKEKDWNVVMPGDSHPLRFDKLEKQRHKRSGGTKLHQIIAKLEGWEALPPVTVSKVGVYFRHAVKEIVSSSNVYRPLDPVRVVFSVMLEGSAQKVVTVRSALVIRSRVKVPVQIHLIRNADNQIILPRLDPGDVQYVPIQFTGFGVKIRPIFSSKYLYRPSTQTIFWSEIDKDADSVSDMITCPCESKKGFEPFRFAICVKKKHFPSLEDVVERLTAEHPQNLSSETKYGQVSPHMPGHTIVILPPVVVSNLLPCELQYTFKNTPAGGKLSPGQDATLHILNLIPESDEPPLILGCNLEGFKECRDLTISHIERNSQMRMVMMDYENRTLILNVRVFWRLGCSVKISVMAGYWIANKTGLPIVVKQEGAAKSFAGQYEEHERARSLIPLPFSYSDRDLPYLCTMRLGRECSQDFTVRSSKYPHAVSTPYCQSFSIDGGTCTRQLKMSHHDDSPSRVYYIGVGVQRGWGRYLHTHIVNLAPRFLLLNMTKERTLSFAQKHATSFTNDATGLNKHLTINAGSSVVFHWPRADLDLLLCTRLKDESNCRWSGGFVIDKIDAFHIHLRIFGNNLSPGNFSVFLRVEITLVDATFRVMFYDGDISSCPSPLRIDNISSAPLVIRQHNTDEGLQISIPPSTQVPYACDEPCMPPLIYCQVRGASVATYLDMDQIGQEKELRYENFIYIVVGVTSSGSKSDFGPVDDNEPYVLAVEETMYGHSVDGMSCMVTLERKETGKRSQLWQITREGFLRHEGSSPPSVVSNYHSSTVIQGNVLDIAELMWKDEWMPLTVRPVDLSRRGQIWRFMEDGRLCCGIGSDTLCIQAYPGNVVGLGLYTQSSIVAPSQHCRREDMIGGSGMLSLKVVRDGPTRVIRVIDITQKRAGIGRDSGSWTLITRQPSSHSVDPVSFNKKDDAKYKNVNINIDMTKGIGISLISNTPDELLYLTLSGVRLSASLDGKSQKFTLCIQQIQIDNQLFGSRPQVVLHPYKSSVQSSSSSTDPHPALSIEAVKLPSTNKLYDIYHSLSINIGRMCLLLEETLLLKLIQFFNSGISSNPDKSLLDETKIDLTQNVTASDVIASRRFYFDRLHFGIQSPLNLSVYTASKSNMQSDLKAIKQSSTLFLIQFERAPVMMQPYERHHVFESSAFILDEAKTHLTDQLRGQAAKILGSVDFLGNPIGLLVDLKAGLGSFVRGRPTGTFKHITHGLSNSAAKVAGTLSNFSGGITMDQDHEEKRRAIKSNTNKASDHVVAGLQSLGTGLVGGLTSIVTQTVKGTSDEGAKGFFRGLGKGLIGTVTKPVTGVLDFASETASFVRESSAPPEMQVSKVRLARNCHSFQGCLECFSQSKAENQQFLHQINSNDYSEWAYSIIEINKRRADSMLFVITNKRVYLMRSNQAEEENIALQVDYNNLLRATAYMQQGEWCFELTYRMDARQPGGAQMHYSSSSSNLGYQIRRPKIVCHSESTATRICEHINYAKILSAGQSETLPPNDDDIESNKTFDLEV